MECPKCGFALGPFDEECPRCKRLAPQEPSAREYEPVASSAGPSGKPIGAMDGDLGAIMGRRSQTVQWALLAIGVAIVLLLAALVFALLQRPAPSTTVVQLPSQQAYPMQGQYGLLPQGQTQSQSPAMAPDGSLAEAEQRNAEALRAPGDDLTMGDEYEGPEPEPRVWREAYRFSGNGMVITPPITVRRPWRVRYYTGTSPASDLGLDSFAIFRGSGTLAVPFVFLQQPEVQGEGRGPRGGTFPLTIVTNFNGWVVIVDQGE